MNEFARLLGDAQRHGPAAVRTLARLLDASDDRTRREAAEVLAKLATGAGELAHLAERTDARPPYAGATLVVGPRPDDAAGPIHGASVWHLNERDWHRCQKN